MKFNFPLFNTQRLRMRPFTESTADFNFLRKLGTNPDVMEYLGHGRLQTLPETEAYLEKVLSDYKKYGLGLYAIESIENDELIGRGGLIPWDFKGKLFWEIGYTFDRPYWGCGYATEVASAMKQWARTNMDLPYVVSFIHPENISSKKVSQKIGMKLWQRVEWNSHNFDIFKLDLENSKLN